MAQPSTHAILRWNARRMLLENERVLAVKALAAAFTEEERAKRQADLEAVILQLAALGPNPSAKMG
jgi:hypothetical protein